MENFELGIQNLEGDINPWYQSGPFENEVREITDDRDKMYSRITSNVKKHYEGQYFIFFLNFGNIEISARIRA